MDRFPLYDSPVNSSSRHATGASTSKSAAVLKLADDDEEYDDYFNNLHTNLQSVIDSTPQQLLQRLSGLDQQNDGSNSYDDKSPFENNISLADFLPNRAINIQGGALQHSPFNGRHAIWQFFDCSKPESGAYYCQASPGCNSSYSWPPSTTVAGRHLRDRHPEIYNQVMEEEASRKSVFDSRGNAIEAPWNKSGNTIGAGGPKIVVNNRKRSAPFSTYISAVEPHNSSQRSSQFAQKCDNAQAMASPVSSNQRSSTGQRSFDNSSSLKDSPKFTATVCSVKPVKMEDIMCKNIAGQSSKESEQKEFRTWKRAKIIEVLDEHAESPKESTSTVSVSWEENEKTVELKGSLAKMREQEMAMKLKHQKTTEQLQDIQAEVENLRSRNEQLEKRQKNFNNELKTIRDQSDEILQEKERLEKQCFEQNMATSRRNTEIMQLKEENAEIRNHLAKARRDLESLESTNAKGDASDNELSTLRKLKREQETRIVELEDELEETLQKNQLLEQNITRLEMSVERSRSETQRDAESKEGEIAELRSQYQRRLRAFEDQLNDLSDANNSLIKQNRLLETRTRQLDSQSHASSMDLSSNHHYKRELRKALALWRDTQALLNHERESAPNQSLLRQLKEQLEDAEAAKLSAQKSRHSLENELADLRSQLEMAEVAKTTAEEKVLTIMREKNAATSLVQEQDEQLQELLKKYKAQIQQSHVDAISLTDQIEQIGSLERAKQRLQEQLNEIASTMEFNKLHMVEKHKMQLLELKLRDVQAKLDLEVSHKLRLESIVVKLREEVESLQEQFIEAKSVKDKELETSRRNKKETLLLQEQINELKKRETELAHKLKLSKTDNEKLVEEHHTTTGDLKLAMKRIDALQAALNADVTAGSDIEEEDENEDENREENTSSIVDEDDTSATKHLSNGVHGS
ncbi:unconventional myosin-XVIIIa [Ditylenchus destructor]|uniref:Unconventional myosin-XVIIIa n=1 Tax=Ditylenchus destructor TaxID=166010 RepID=A0AAD4R786_9BILA|nr:unconventional myosin-XVIIIa [Ditylenchus destructor]